MKLSDWRIGARLAVGICTLLLLAMALGVAGAWSMREYDTAAKDMKSALQGEVLTTEWERLLDAQSVTVDAFFSSTDAELVNRLSSAIKSQNSRIDVVLQELLSLAPPRARKYFDSIAQAASIYSEHRDQAMSLKRSSAAQGEAQLAVKLREEMYPRMNEYKKAVEGLRSRTHDVSRGAAENAQKTYQTGQVLLASCAGVTLVLGLLLGWLLTRSITVPLAHAVKVADTVAAGDLTLVIDSSATDETGQLLRALAAMNANLGRMVSQIREGAESISTASSEIASGNADLSSRTEQQAAALQETAASMQQLSSTVRLNADNAQQARRLAGEASDVADRGGVATAEVVATMEQISESSKQIADIIGVIEGIAFQTNLLALNAATEAARAGELGRGFAVVAGEVRNLASRSAQAAKEIKGLIAKSSGKVELGVQQVRTAGATTQEVVESFKRVSTLVSEISNASLEQSRGIDQVKQAMAQMDDTTQRNAALVEEASAAASSLQTQADGLVVVVSAFRVA